MSKVQMLRALVKQRLTAAAEDIFGLFERTIAEYEETLCRSKEENERQRRLLDAVFNPQLRLHRAGFPADVQQLLVIKKEVPPEQQEWNPSLDQEDPPEPPHIKEEQEEVWTSQEGEQLQGLEEADITKFTFTPVPVKNEDDDEEKPQSSQLHQRQTDQMETEGDGEDCGGPEPDRNSHPDTHLEPVSEDNSLDSTETDVSDDDWEESREPQSSKLQQPQIGQIGTEADGEDCGGQTECRLTDCPDSHLTSDTEDKTGDSSETDVSDGDWEATREAQSGLNSLKNNDILVSDGCPPDEKPFSCSVCCKGFSQKDNLIHHMTRHTGEKLFSCSVCKKRFRHRGAAGRHMKIHTEEKPFSCSVCHKAFRLKAFLVNHMNIHTGEKPFSCSVCGRRFSQKVNVQTHMRTHTEEREAKGKPFSCSVCYKLFNRRSHFIEHMRRHTGEKPFACPVCLKAFCVKSILVTHMKIHTGEKPFSCSICGKRFTQKGNLTTHMGLHTKDSVDCESRQHIAESSSSSLASCKKLSPAWSTPTAAANQSDPPTVLYGINTGPPPPPHDGLWTFLQNRVVPEENIQNMQQGRIDTSLIREIDDASMAAYIPVYSDATGPTVEGGDDPKRLSLFEKLRRKMETKTNHKDPDSEEDESYMKPIRTHLINNKRALKMTRRIELGWIHDKKQVRKRSGGGTRLVDISKKATKTEILSVAKTIFFPNETSRKGRWEEFSHDIVDFQEAYLDEGVTVGELYETHVRKLRFYLFTERLTNEVFTEEDTGRSHDQQKHITEDDEQMTHKPLDSQCWEFLYRSSHTTYP